jgi:hypothetical protein
MGPMNCRCLLWSLPAALLLAAASGARGDVVFSNLGPGDTFANSAWVVQGFDPPSGRLDINVAAAFTVGPNAYTLTSADLALYRGPGTGPLSVSLMSNSGTLPGSVLLSTSLTTIPESPGGPAVVTALFGGGYTLQANTTYWLMADTNADTVVYWEQNLLGAKGQAVQFNGDPWVLSDQDTTAFRINGSAVPTAVAVPLPSAAAARLTLLPLVLLARAMRRRTT